MKKKRVMDQIRFNDDVGFCFALVANKDKRANGFRMDHLGTICDMKKVLILHPIDD